MGRSCMIPGCKADWRIVHHQIPKSAKKSELWLEAIKIKGLDNLPEGEKCKYRVCGRHFCKDDYIFTLNRRRLKDNAIPSLNIPNAYSIISTETSKKNIDNISDFTYIDGREIQDIKKSITVQQQVEENVMYTVNYSDVFLRNDIASNEVRTIYYDDNTSTHQIIQGNAKEELPEKKTNLTPIEKRLYNIANFLLKQNRYSNKRNMNLDKRMKYLLQSPYIKEIETMSQTQRLFIEIQLYIARQINTHQIGPIVFDYITPATVRHISSKLMLNQMAKRYSMDEKVLALSLFKESRKCYALLRQLCSMPSPKTLKCMLQRISLQPGVSKIIMTYLTEKANNMNNNEKYCILMWDEMALTPHVQYDAVHDVIVGFEDWGHRRTNKFADHALVFMLRGLKSGWKMPVSYGFYENQTKIPQLVQCIKSVVKSVKQTGLKVVATVCDQSACNVAAINILLQNTIKRKWQRDEQYRDVIEIEDTVIIPFFDPPHLIKDVRNNLLNKDLEINISKDTKNKEFASWKTIETAYKIDICSKHLTRLLPKITEEHVIPKKIKKIKVKYATQIFSRRVSAYIGQFSHMQGYFETEMGPLSIPKEDSASMTKVLTFFNDLFDSINGYNSKSDLQTPLRTILKDNSPHHEFWIYAIAQLKDMRFVDPISKKITAGSKCLKNWIKTLNSFQELWKLLRKESFKSLQTRLVNQDPLENFFSYIKATGYKDNNPTCTGFRGAYKVLLINNLSSRRSVRRNCEDICDGELLFTLKELISNDEQESIDIDKIKQEIPDNVDTIDSEIQSNMHELNKTSYHNILKNKLLKDMCKHCSLCKITVNGYNERREEAFKRMEHKIKRYINQFYYTYNIKQKMYNIVQEEIDLSFIQCGQHYKKLKKLIISQFITLNIRNWCTLINKILCGEETRLSKNIIIRRAVKKYNSNVKKSCRITD